MFIVLHPHWDVCLSAHGDTELNSVTKNNAHKKQYIIISGSFYFEERR